MAYGDSSNVKPLVSQDTANSDSVITSLRWAKKIVLKKAIMSLNSQYTVSADGKIVGKIRGQYIHILGDTFSLFSTANNLVASEGEGYRLITHKASLYDYNNKPAGEIKEDLSFLLTKWSLYDQAGTAIGSAQQNLSLTLGFTLKSAAGVDEYKISKAMFSFGAQLTITKLTNEPTIPVMDAVWLAAIANEIAEAQSQKNSSKNDN